MILAFIAPRILNLMFLSQVAVLDMSSLSVLFFTDCVSSSSSPVISVTWKNCGSIESLVKSPKETNIVANHAEEVMFVLTKDALLNIIDGGSGSMMNSHPWRPKKEINCNFHVCYRQV